MATRQERDERVQNQAQRVSQTDEQRAIADGEEMSQDLQQRINEVIQPMISDLQRHITKTVEQQLAHSGAQQPEISGASESGEGVLDSAGEWVQRSFASLMAMLERIREWILRMARELGDKVAEAIGELASIIVQRAIKSAF